MRAILRKFNVLPRWVILLLDHFIIVISYVLATLIRFNFNLDNAERWLSPKRILAVLVAHLFFSQIFKPHTGIIRYTHKEDIMAVGKTLVSATLLLAVSNLFIKYYFPPRYVIPYSILIIAALMNSVALSGYRFLVKEIFENAITSLGKRKNILVFGAGKTGRTASRILQDNKSNYSIRGFLDDNPKLWESKINGIKITKPELGLDTFKVGQIDEILIAISNLSSSRRNWIVDEALKKQIQVKEVPASSKWVSGNLSEKQFRDVRIEDLLGRDAIDLDKSNINKYYGGKVVLITGAAGSIGSEITRQVVRLKPETLLLVDQAESALYDVQQELISNGYNDLIHVIICDITRPSLVRNIFNQFRPDIVFHAAAYKHVPLMEAFPLESIRTNIGGTKVLADLSVEFEVEKYIMVSTDKAVNPTNIMGACKRAAEIYIQTLSKTAKVDFITTRFGNVLGSNGSLIPLLQRQIAKGGPLTITHPEITRFFMTIPEACSLVLEAGSMGKKSEVFVFDMGKPIKILDLARKMLKLAGLQEGKDIEIRFIGLRPGEKLYEEVLLNLENIKETFHPKIRIAQVAKQDLPTIQKLIREILDYESAGEEEACVLTLKKLIPEFVSNQSKYESLDFPKLKAGN